MEVPTPPYQHPALRPTEPVKRSGSKVQTDSYTSDKKQIINWLTGVVGAALLAGVGWTGTHVLSAESVNTEQSLRIKGLEERAAEDRTVIRDQLKEHSEKLDRLLERSK